MVGETDGDIVGSEVVGDWVGDLDGDTVGSEVVGEMDGDTVGDDVGAHVTPQQEPAHFSFMVASQHAPVSRTTWQTESWKMLLSEHAGDAVGSELVGD